MIGYVNLKCQGDLQKLDVKFSASCYRKVWKMHFAVCCDMGSKVEVIFVVRRTLHDHVVILVVVLVMMMTKAVMGCIGKYYIQ